MPAFSLELLQQPFHKYFQEGKLQTGAVLVQKCGDVRFELKSKTIKTVRQSFRKTDTVGAYWYEAEPGKAFTSTKNFKLANENPSREETSIEKLEERFWNSIGLEKVIYGTDLDCKCTFLENINSEFGILDKLCCDIPGITKPYAYYGSWGTHFTWHTEDMDTELQNVTYMAYISM